MNEQSSPGGGEEGTAREKERKSTESNRTRVHTSDVSERMQPSQSEVRREYKSRRVIYPSCVRQRYTYAHARENRGRAHRHMAAPWIEVDLLLALVPPLLPTLPFGGRSLLHILRFSPSPPLLPYSPPPSLSSSLSSLLRTQLPPPFVKRVFE